VTDASTKSAADAKKDLGEAAASHTANWEVDRLQSDHDGSMGYPWRMGNMATKKAETLALENEGKL